MKLSLGENMKKFRIEHEWTQEKLADILNVTPQAVSRWETGTVYPDVTVLITLANLFSVSLDELVGREELRGSMNLPAMHTSVNEYRKIGKNREAAAILRDAAKIYPNNEGILSELAVTIARIEDVTAEELEEAIGASRSIEESVSGIKVRATTHANEVFLLMRAGEQEQAEHVAKNTGHIWESREMIMPECVSDEEFPDVFRESVRKALCMLGTLIEESKTHRAGFPGDHIAHGVQWNDGKNDKERLEIIREFLLAEEEL